MALLKDLFVKTDKSTLKKTTESTKSPSKGTSKHKRQSSSMPGATSFLTPTADAATATKPISRAGKPSSSGMEGNVWDLPPLPALPAFARPKTHLEQALEEVHKENHGMGELRWRSVRPVRV
ncbi:hypothetical protein IAR50_005128 [Cryptococcus sp. DSM 104548]